MINLSKIFLQFRIRIWLKKANNFYLNRQYHAAIPLYQKILQLQPRHYAALCNLASAFFEDRDYKQARHYFLQLQKIDSVNPWWSTYLSQIYQKQRAYRQALNSAWTAVKLSSSETEHQINLAYACYEIALIKGQKFVADLVQKFYHEYPDSPIAQQCYDSFFSGADSLCCNLQYVEKIFDVFAGEFDATLHKLHYDSPDFIARILAKFYHEKNHDLTILDLGCGSGLCAQAIRKFFPRAAIYGVDISALMLQQADAKKLYTNLVKNDLLSYLQATTDSFDVIVASDVFTYFGCLDYIIKYVALRLKKNGVFAFTVSQNLLNHQSYYLTISSRFVHNFAYVRNLLQLQGFTLLKVYRKAIRKEGKSDVFGGVFLAVKN